MKSKYRVSWDHWAEACEELIVQVKASGVEYKYVYGIPRGGLIPAVILAHQLKLDLIRNPLELGSRSERVFLLVVDDICDTGKTFKADSLSNVDKAAVFYRGVKCDIRFYGEKLQTKAYLVFPWERD
jgi:hypoxanthine phosphoribosyltransferase